MKLREFFPALTFGNPKIQELARKGFRWWYMEAPPFQFNVIYDAIENVYSATWKNAIFSTVPNVHKSNFIGTNIHPRVHLPYFNTLKEAEDACKAKAKELKAK